ncbi:MAG: InlB B-repeat-containing protein [Bulleidia sp.]|nr:InlB B-repeat-containing protein [Bulleidia sp.]
MTFNDQKGNVTTVKAEEGSEVAFPQDPACDGFKFEGWFTEAKNGTKITSLIAEKDMTVYAQWTDLKKAEVKNGKSADTSDKTNIVIYVAGFIFKNRMHSAK